MPQRLAPGPLPGMKFCHTPNDFIQGNQNSLELGMGDGCLNNDLGLKKFGGSFYSHDHHRYLLQDTYKIATISTTCWTYKIGSK
jgi:hypothetical protein